MTRVVNAGLVACAAASGLAWVIGVARHGWPDTVTEAFLLLVPAAAGVGLLGCLRLREALRSAVFVGVLSSAAAVYAAEWFLGGAGASGAAGAAWYRGRAFDARPRAVLIQQLREQGLDAYPAVAPHVLLQAGRDGVQRSPIHVAGQEVLPLGGIPGVPTVLCNELGGYLVYQSDERGFHNPVGSWDRVPAEVFVVGDSYVQGACVPSEENLVARIRRVHPGTLNAGLIGNGPLSLLATIREYGPLARPRQVLWCHFEGNDVPLDLRRESSSPILRRYVEDGGFHQPLLARSTAVRERVMARVEALLETELEEGRWSARALRDWLLLRRLRVSAGFVYGAADQRVHDTDLALFRRVLLRAREGASAWGGRLVFVYLPAWEGATRSGGWSSLAYEQVRPLVREIGLPFVDVRSAFRAQTDPRELFVCPRCHYSIAGYEVAARTILEALNAPNDASES